MVFTGLIETTGTIVRAGPDRGGLTLGVRATFSREPLALGESIAVSGACLTVESVLADGFVTFASSETLQATTLGGLRAGAAVNLERAMPADGRFGGHMVAGHVDGVGRVRTVTPSGSASRIAFDVPSDLGRYLAAKGSVAVDGVSLTINRVAGPSFEVMVIPHTLSHTTLPRLRPGMTVNIEVDLVARYLEALSGARSGGGLADRMRAAGFAIDD